MKSKTSFFNKTIFFKNIRRYWLLPAVYLFCFIWAMPVTMYFGYRSDYGYLNTIDKLNDIRHAVVNGYLIVSLVFAIGAGLLTAMCVFSYLQRSASVNFFHSLPSDRKQMFFTNLLSGFAMIAAPAAITCFITMLVGLCIDVNIIPQLLVWLLVTLIMAAFFYMFAVICNLISGQGWFGSGIYVILLIYFLGMMALCVAIISMINIGCSVDFWLPEGIWGIVSPITFFARDILDIDQSVVTRGAGAVLSAFSMIMIEGMIFTVLFVIAAYYLYKFRHSESAGDTVAFRFARPIFRWGFAISFSLLLTVIMLATINGGHGVSKVVMIFFLVVFGILGFIIAQMLVKKSVHVFKLAKAQKNQTVGFPYELAGFGVFILIIGVIVSISALKVNKYVPDESDVRSVMINSNYGTWTENIYDRTIISEVVAIHQDVIDEFDLLTEYDDSRWDHGYNDFSWQYINISYTLFNGKIVNRNFTLPDRMKAYDHIENMYSRRDLMLKLTFGEVDKNKIGAAYLMENTYGYDSIACYYSDAISLYDAFLADVNDGNVNFDDIFADRYLMPVESKTEYNYDDEYYDSVDGYDQEIPFEIVGLDFSTDDYEYVLAFQPIDSRNKYFCLKLNDKCTHTLEAMKKCKWLM